jgi:hypothetical protein
MISCLGPQIKHFLVYSQPRINHRHACLNTDLCYRNPNPKLAYKLLHEYEILGLPYAATSSPLPLGPAQHHPCARAMMPCRRSLPTEKRADGRAVRRRMVTCVAGRRATRRRSQRTDAAGQHLRTPADSTDGIPPPRRLPRGWTRNRRAEEREMDARPLAAEPPPAVVNE